MPNLGDYIGQLMAEITLARVQADLEAVRLAEHYAKHPLLKTFPVPRFRLPDVTLDFPIAIAAVHPPRDSVGIDVAKALSVFKTALSEQIGESGVKLTAAEKRNLHDAVDKRFETLRISDLVSTSSVSVADAVTNTVEKFLSVETVGGDERSRFIDAIRDRARAALLSLVPAPSRVQVVTNTAELRELPPQAVTRLQLTITEQGVEWKGDGKKLLPE